MSVEKKKSQSFEQLTASTLIYFNFFESFCLPYQICAFTHSTNMHAHTQTHIWMYMITKLIFLCVYVMFSLGVEIPVAPPTTPSSSTEGPSGEYSRESNICFIFSFYLSICCCASVQAHHPLRRTCGEYCGSMYTRMWDFSTVPRLATIFFHKCKNRLRDKLDPSCLPPPY